MTTPTLNLYGLPHPPLHHPKLAAAACWLFAAASLLEILMDVFVLTPTPGVPELLFLKIATLGFCCVAAITAVAALLLFIANIARGRFSPWPLRGILFFILVYASLAMFSQIRFLMLLLLKGESWPFYLTNADLPFFIMALASAASAYAFGFIYGLQLAAFLGNKTLRRASIFILAPALLIWASGAAYYGGGLANSYHIGIGIPLWLFNEIYTSWVIAKLTVSIALTAFFLIAACRLRRLARR